MGCPPFSCLLRLLITSPHLVLSQVPIQHHFWARKEALLPSTSAISFSVSWSPQPAGFSGFERSFSPGSTTSSLSFLASSFWPPRHLPVVASLSLSFSLLYTHGLRPRRTSIRGGVVVVSLLSPSHFDSLTHNISPFLLNITSPRPGLTPATAYPGASYPVMYKLIIIPWSS